MCSSPAAGRPDFWAAWRASLERQTADGPLPAGVQLDAAHTPMVTLERLPQPADAPLLDLVIDRASMVGTYLRSTKVVCVMALTLDGTVKFANEAACQALGVELHQLEGWPIFPHLTEADVQLVQRVLRGEQAVERAIPLNFCDPDGHPLTLCCRFQRTCADCVIFGEREYAYERELQRHLLAANEELSNLVRERHRATLAEQASRRSAELANHTRDEALAIISHEMCQPLKAAVTALELLKARPHALDPARETLERQLAQLMKLIEELMDASHVVRGNVHLRKQRVDLRKITEQSVELIRPVADQRQQHLSVSLGGDALEVEVDPARFAQVLGNVLTNASRYTPRSGSIRVRVEREPRHGVVRVADTGAGVPPDALEHLFELFFRSTEQPGGFGIGLAVARGLVQMHGGSIAAHSDGPGQGAEFVLQWPLAGST